MCFKMAIPRSSPSYGPRYTIFIYLFLTTATSR
jgi:hypothetical protein